jgi:hypothetical protein
VTEAKMLNEVYRTLGQSDSVRYVIGSMQPIDPEYTKNTYAQGDRVKNQLEKRLDDKCDYEYQGSVTNDTHIKARSDIDLLVLTGKYTTLEKPQEPAHPYEGDPIQDLLDLRSNADDSLRAAFPEATVDSSGSKSVAIEGGSLRRKIDVVPSNWFDTNQYAASKEKKYRGVQILDAKKKQRLKNTPFLHNALIAFKDQNTGGGLRKAARLMKSLKYDTESIDLSSYDIVAIAFNIPNEEIAVPKGWELAILNACHNYCRRLQMDSNLRGLIDVPDGHRKVFAEGHATKQGLDQMTYALEQLVEDVLTENVRSFKKLAEARVEY